MERIAISALQPGPSEDLEALAAWLDQELELRGLVKLDAPPPDSGELGTYADALIAAVGAGGTASVLAASLKVFFTQPRGVKVRLRVTRADGTHLELDADRVARESVAQLAQQLVHDALDAGEQ